MWVFIYTILFSFSSILYGVIDTISSKYDRVFLKDNETKSKFRLIIEIFIQLEQLPLVFIYLEN